MTSRSTRPQHIVTLPRYLGPICGYLHAINHSSAACHRSIARTRQNRHCVRYSLVRPVAQVSTPPVPAQECRAPTIRAALLLTGSGPTPMLLLQYHAVAVGRRGAQTRPCRGAATEGVQARKPMSAAYRQENQKRISGAQGEGMGPLVSISTAAAAAAAGSQQPWHRHGAGRQRQLTRHWRHSRAG